MRKGVICVALLIWASAITGWGQSGKEGKTETVARWHFLGTQQIAADKDLPTLREVLALKQSQDLRDVALEVFAGRLAARFTKGADTNENARVAALIKPLLPDVIQNESHFELIARGGEDAGWFLALKLSPERTAEWSRNLTNLAGAARMQVTQAEKNEGWSAEGNNYRVAFSPSKEWLLLEGGSGTKAGKPRKAPKSGGKEILSAEINSSLVAKFWGNKDLEHAPKLSLTVVPKEDELRSEMLIEYPQSLNITPERWNVPTELIKDPLVGFTAIQGIAGTLAKNPQLTQLGAQKTPNQAFLWSQSTMSFTVFAAADVGNPGIVISNIVTQVLPNLSTNAGGKIVVSTNRPVITWRDLPVVVPFVEAAEAGRSPYLVAGLFPIFDERAKPAPPELFAQLNQKNLVYYDWEITQGRLKQWRPIWQFAQIMRGKFFGNSASEAWIEALMPKLGNTVTAVTLQNQKQLKLVRQSQIGFNALELVLLAHALDPNDIQERPQRGTGQPVRRNPTATKR